VEPRFTHLNRTGIFRVAEANAKIVSICSAIVRADRWFLSMFWTLPEWQNKAVGKPLLKQVWEHGRDRGAKHYFTWSSVDFAALATYMKLGMLPICQIFTFAGRPSVLTEIEAGYEIEPLYRQIASELDLGIFGDARESDHEFWERSSGAGCQVVHNGRKVGYFYSKDGTIGPAGWSEPMYANDVMNLALREASRQARDVKLMSVAANHAAVQAALRVGLRLVGNGHLLSTQTMESLVRYLPSGPALF
jgi:GNAT superfamily N-acetyltransferase